MPCFICETCGTQFADSPTPPAACAVCTDDRQYVAPRGQHWTSHDRLLADRAVRLGDDDGAIALAVTPDFGIAQRAIFAPATDARVLWECLSVVTDDAVANLTARGGVDAIAISHPHFYTAMVEWSDALGGVPILVHEADDDWVRRRSRHVELWSGPRYSISDELTLVHCPGHFPGSAVLHWAHGPHDRPALLSGDSMQVAADRRHVSFMYSYPNLIPLAPSTVRQMRELLSGYDFDDIYGYSWGRNIIGGGRAGVDASFDRYLAALERPR
jgi:hypothetical protein